MRYFVLTKDYEIVPAYMVYKDDRVQYFCANNRRYRFWLDESHSSLRFFSVQRRDGDWEYTLDIKYFYELNEKGNEELNYFDSTDFNAGYIYARMERSLHKHLDLGEKEEVTISMDIPKIQMVLGTSDFKDAEIIKATLDMVENHFNATYGKNFSLDELTWNKYKQYIAVHFKISKKQKPKELTVTEIEKLLGYKIKIVGENNENN